MGSSAALLAEGDKMLNALSGCLLRASYGLMAGVILGAISKEWFGIGGSVFVFFIAFIAMLIIPIPNIQLKFNWELVGAFAFAIVVTGMVGIETFRQLVPAQTPGTVDVTACQVAKSYLGVNDPCPTGNAREIRDWLSTGK